MIVMKTLKKIMRMPTTVVMTITQDKLFLCLWFWLAGVSVVTGASLIYRSHI